MHAGRPCSPRIAALLAAPAPPSPTPLPELAGVPAAFEMSGRLAVRQGRAQRHREAALDATRGASDVWVIVVAARQRGRAHRVATRERRDTRARPGGGAHGATAFARRSRERCLGVRARSGGARALAARRRPAAGRGLEGRRSRRRRRAGADRHRAPHHRHRAATPWCKLVVDEYRALEDCAMHAARARDYPAPAKLNLFLHVVGPARRRLSPAAKRLHAHRPLRTSCASRVRDDGEIRRVSDVPGVPAGRGPRGPRGAAAASARPARR